MYSAFQFHLWTRPCARGNRKGGTGGERQRTSGYFAPKRGRSPECRQGKKGAERGIVSGIGDAWGKLQNTWVFSEAPHNPTKRKPAKTFWAFTGFLKKAMQFSCVNLRRQPWSSLVPAQDSRHQIPPRSERAAAHFSLFSELLQTLPTKSEGLEKPGVEAPELPTGFLGYCSARYIKVTICARLQSVSGLKVVAPVPEVTPSLTAQRTASA